MNTIEIVANIAIVLTILLFLSGIPLCIQVYKIGSSAGFSVIPFITGFVCNALWFKYGMLLNDTTTVFINTVGLTFQTLYISCLYKYSNDKETFHKQVLYLASFLLIIFSLTWFGDNPLPLLGTFASGSTIAATCAPLVSLKQVISTKSTEKLPFLMIVASFAVSLSWFVYGFLLSDLYIQVPNCIGVISAAFQLSLFVIYPSKPKKIHQK